MVRKGEFYDQDQDNSPVPADDKPARPRLVNPHQFYDQDEVEAWEAPPPPEPAPLPDPGVSAPSRPTVDIYSVVRERQGLPSPPDDWVARPSGSHPAVGPGPFRASEPPPPPDPTPPPEPPPPAPEPEPSEWTEAAEWTEPDESTEPDEWAEPDGWAEPDEWAEPDGWAEPAAWSDPVPGAFGAFDLTQPLRVVPPMGASGDTAPGTLVTDVPPAYPLPPEPLPAAPPPAERLPDVGVVNPGANDAPTVERPTLRRPPTATEPPATEQPPATPPEDRTGTDDGTGTDTAAEERRRGRNTGIVASGTFLSRVTGFLRTITILGVLGSGGLGDAYYLANTVPAIVYDLVLGGVLSATMVPVFVDQYRRTDREAGMRSISAVLTTIFSVLVVVAIALAVFAPAVIHFYLLFNHQTTGADERAVGTSLLRLFAPQVVFLGAVVVTTALLNARRHFGAPAFSPVVNNLILIGAIVATKFVAQSVEIGPFRHDHSAILVLGLGTSLGYFVQFLLHLPALAKAGIRFRPVFDFRDPAVRRIAHLSSWLFGVVLANQATFTVIILLAAQRAGDYTIYTAAYTFFQLPYALFAVSIATVLTPDLAERWADRDVAGYRRRVIAGLRVTLAVLTPAGIGYALVARPAILLAANHGATSAASAHLLATCLALFALGLPGYSAFIFLMRGLQAMQNARGVFGAYVLQAGMQIAAAFALYPRLGVKGLCLAWVGPATISAFVAVRQLRPRIHSFGGWPTIRAILRVAVSTAIMAVAVLAVGRVMPGGDRDLALAAKLVAQIVAGTAVYIYAARTFGVGELDPVLATAARLVWRRRRSRPVGRHARPA